MQLKNKDIVSTQFLSMEEIRHIFRHGLTGTKPGYLLKNQQSDSVAISVEIRIFAQSYKVMLF